MISAAVLIITIIAAFTVGYVLGYSSGREYQRYIVTKGITDND